SQRPCAGHLYRHTYFRLPGTRSTRSERHAGRRGRTVDVDGDTAKLVVLRARGWLGAAAAKPRGHVGRRGPELYRDSLRAGGQLAHRERRRSDAWKPDGV